MIDVICDLEVFAAKEVMLPPAIKAALWDYIARVADNPDNPDLMDVERDGFRSFQFTSGWALDWEVTRRKRNRIVGLFTDGVPEEIKLWDLRDLRSSR